uniref:Uncharacterized protein n=1 Tax=Anguilla anguilla TaxID=7936 RepID=A0A0E9VA53_ANGAN
MSLNSHLICAALALLL